MKTAIITGASGSIGGAIAKRLAGAGYTLVLIGNRSTKRLEDISKLCQNSAKLYKKEIHTLSGDLGRAADARNLMNQALILLGKVDLLVNCAGISYIGLVSDMTDEEWLNILNTNLSSLFYCCRTIIPSMVHEKAGHILNISSIWGNSGASCEAAYSATKGGLNAFTKALAKELAPSGIAVNALACGMIDTPMNSVFSEDEIRQICEEIPAGRMGTPEEVADMAFRLAEAPSYLTGQIVTIDGGWT